MKIAAITFIAVLAASTAMALPPPCTLGCMRQYQACIRVRPRDVCEQQRDDCYANCDD
ncbi:hypothetical protein GQ42DRAFT_87725 [Ramicandelaber brevisporus]|nr:hypothetical protein GQ42DRAFT_87725 [Ramicandelaber brevisporus]